MGGKKCSSSLLAQRTATPPWGPPSRMILIGELSRPSRPTRVRSLGVLSIVVGGGGGGCWW